MNPEYNIELLEEHDIINLYTIRIKGEAFSEFEKFLNKFPDNSENKKDIDIILAWIGKIIEKGALERYFRPEGRMADGVCAIPIEVNKIRLYCLRIRDNILILGNGDIKDTPTYNEKDNLRCYVEILQDADEQIKKNIISGDIVIKSKELTGKLHFKQK